MNVFLPPALAVGAPRATACHGARGGQGVQRVLLSAPPPTEYWPFNHCSRSAHSAPRPGGATPCHAHCYAESTVPSRLPPPGLLPPPPHAAFAPRRPAGPQALKPAVALSSYDKRYNSLGTPLLPSSYPCPCLPEPSRACGPSPSRCACNKGASASSPPTRTYLLPFNMVDTPVLAGPMLLHAPASRSVPGRDCTRPGLYGSTALRCALALLIPGSPSYSAEPPPASAASAASAAQRPFHFAAIPTPRSEARLALDLPHPPLGLLLWAPPPLPAAAQPSTA